MRKGWFFRSVPSLLRLCKSPLFYKTTISLHLYVGLFVAPFVLIFAVSVIVINHRHPVRGEKPAISTETKTIDSLPESLDSLDSVYRIMEQAGITGWVTFFRHIEEKNQFRFIVLRPTVRKNVSVDLEKKTLEIQNLPNDLKSTLYWLHVFPGPHTQYKNWFFLFLWWALADGVAYGSIFLGMSGIYLWYFLKQERKIGLVLMTAAMVGLALVLVPLLG